MQKYSNIQILYHWLTVLMVLFLAGSGLAYTYEIADAGRGTIVAHQIAGQVLIVVLAFRIVTRFVRKAPDTEASHAPWERRLARAVHIALYVSLVVFVVTGYVSASAMSSNALAAPVDMGFARSDTGERFLDTHFAMKWVLLGLFGLHFAGVLKHALVDRDSTLSSMRFSSFR